MQDLVANKNDQVIPSTTSVSILCKKLSLFQFVAKKNTFPSVKYLHLALDWFLKAPSAGAH